MKYFKIENNVDLLRDSSTGAIINTNTVACDNYLKNYHRLKKERQELESLKTQVSELSSSIGEIKTLLSLLIEGKNHDNSKI